MRRATAHSIATAAAAVVSGRCVGPLCRTVRAVCVGREPLACAADEAAGWDRLRAICLARAGRYPTTGLQDQAELLCREPPWPMFPILVYRLEHKELLQAAIERCEAEVAGQASAVTAGPLYIPVRNTANLPANLPTRQLADKL